MTEQEKQELRQQMAQADADYEKALAEEESTVHPGGVLADAKKRKAKIYIAGRVTGLKPEQYEPLFATVKKELEQAGHEVINPITDIPHEDVSNWALTIMECLPYVAQCDCLALLPGWEKSNGAQMEYHFARGLNLQVLNVRPVGKPNSRQKRKSKKR
jgi:Asp-tRNA(Asn)/Glu-tRNA(Gln) amidotransferase A subunit family amidase